MRPLLSVYSIVVLFRRRSSLLFQYRQGLSTASLSSSSVPPVSVHPPELRQILSPPSLRVRARLSPGRQRVDGILHSVHQAVRLLLNRGARALLLQCSSGPFPDLLPWSVLVQ